MKEACMLIIAQKERKTQMNQEKVIVIDFGGQYNQLVARRVRECNVYCEIYSYKTDLEQIKAMNPKGIILTGGPNSCYEADSPTYQKELFELGVPVLGLCYGAQLMMHVLGGKVEKAPVREYGKTEVSVNQDSPLFQNVSKDTICWMSHFDYISKTAPGFEIVATTADCPVAAAQNLEQKLFAIQFHPEVLHTQEGTKMLYNFVRNICGCAGTWRMDSFVEHSIEEIRKKVGNGKVLCALSGGVDSSVAAVMLSKAIGSQLTCVFVDHGLLRKDEGDEVEEVFGPNGPYELNFIRVNAQERYYTKLAGVTEPEAKRKIIGEEFIRVFEEEAKKIGAVDFLVQGTIYPDVVESGLGGESAVIKSHHNVGGPEFKRASFLGSRIMLISRRLSSHFATCSRTRSARQAWRWAFRRSLYSVSHSQVRAWASVSSEKSPARKSRSCRTLMLFTARKWTRLPKSTSSRTVKHRRGCRTSTSQHSPICVPWV